MEFNKKTWKKEDITAINKYLESIKREEKIEFTKRTVNTKMEVLGVDTPTIRNISKEIAKGNYLSYLEHKNNHFYENTMINACLINRINDISKKQQYLEELLVDNWATCDILTFNIKGHEQEYLTLAKEYIGNKNIFRRRIGIRILFNYTKNGDVQMIYEIIDELYEEEEYYVNMAIAWLLCELMIYHREETLQYLTHHHLNKFVVNKMISKCRDSYRVSKEDKEFLVQYRQK